MPNGVKTEKKTKKRKFLPYGCITIAIILGLIAAGVLGYFWWQGFPWENRDTTPTPPVQATLNPMITSAPQPTATVGPTNTTEPLPTPTETFTPQVTPQDIFPTAEPTLDSAAYPVNTPTVGAQVSPTAYP